jgi:tetratricopeptide (TPR) repeat protein
MGDLYYRAGRLDEAAGKYREALSLKSDFRSSALKLAHLHGLREDHDETAKWIERFATMTPGSGMMGEGFWWKAALHHTLGADSQALRELEQSLDFTRDAQFASGEAKAHWLRSMVYLEKGDWAASRLDMRCWSDYAHHRDPPRVWAEAVLNYHLGRIDLNEGKLDSLAHRIEEMESVHLRVDEERWKNLTAYWHGLLRAELLLAQGNLDQAVAVASDLESPVGLTIDDEIDLFLNPWLPEDVLARAYARRGDVAEAIAEYERLMVPDPNQRGRRMIHPKYHYRLATLYEAAGSDLRAEQEYERFLAIWKHADPGKPEVIDARQRLSALKEANQGL